MRKGFTLIEMLVVVMIIAALAGFAIPRFQESRTRTFFAAMKADLRQLADQEEIYYSSHDWKYAGSAGQAADAIADLQFTNSQGVYVVFRAAGNTGWSADATHAGLDGTTQMCALFYGSAPALPPASSPGLIACKGELGH